MKKAINFEASLPLSTKHRIAQVLFHPKKPMLAVHSHDKTVDVLRIRTEEEVRRKQVRRKRREREKAKASRGDKGDLVVEQAAAPDDELDNSTAKISLVDLFVPYLVVRASGKIRSFSFAEETDAKGATQVCCCLFITLI